MKRADLVVGQEYYYATGHNWGENLYAGSKIIVVDAGCWEQHRPTWGYRASEPRKTNKGSGVLVEMTVNSFVGGEPTVMRKVVNVQGIRGPYAETRKKVEEFEAARAEQYQKTKEAGEANNLKAEAAIEMAKERGIRVRQDKYNTTDIIISAADLTNLIQMSER